MTSFPADWRRPRRGRSKKANVLDVVFGGQLSGKSSKSIRCLPDAIRGRPQVKANGVVSHVLALEHHLVVEDFQAARRDLEWILNSVCENTSTLHQANGEAFVFLGGPSLLVRIMFLNSCPSPPRKATAGIVHSHAAWRWSPRGPLSSAEPGQRISGAADPPSSLQVLQNKALAILRELCFSTAFFSESLAHHRGLVGRLFGLMESDTTFDNAVGLAEEVLAVCEDTLNLRDVANFQSLIARLSSRQLAFFCRVLAMVVYEPEDRSHGVAMVQAQKGDALEKKIQEAAVVNANQDLLLAVPQILPRLVNLLQVKGISFGQQWRSWDEGEWRPLMGAPLSPANGYWAGVEEALSLAHSPGRAPAPLASPRDGAEGAESERGLGGAGEAAQVDGGAEGWSRLAEGEAGIRSSAAAGRRGQGAEAATSAQQAGLDTRGQSPRAGTPRGPAWEDLADHLERALLFSGSVDSYQGGWREAPGGGAGQGLPRWQAEAQGLLPGGIQERSDGGGHALEQEGEGSDGNAGDMEGSSRRSVGTPANLPWEALGHWQGSIDPTGQQGMADREGRGASGHEVRTNRQGRREDVIQQHSDELEQPGTLSRAARAGGMHTDGSHSRSAGPAGATSTSQPLLGEHGPQPRLQESREGPRWLPPRYVGRDAQAGDDVEWRAAAEPVHSRTGEPADLESASPHSVLATGETPRQGRGEAAAASGEQGTQPASAGLPDLPLAFLDRPEETLHVLAIAAHQVEVLFVLSALCGGKRKAQVQRGLAELGLEALLARMFEGLEWAEVPAVPPEPHGIHGHGCACNPQAALKVQFLRLVHNFYSRDGSSTLHQDPGTRDGLTWRAPGRRVPHSTAPGVPQARRIGEHGLMPKIIQVLIAEPADSVYRFWLASCVEAFLRSADAQEQAFVSGTGLMEHLVEGILKDGVAWGSSLQISFDLLGELVKFSPAMLARLECLLEGDKCYRFIQVLLAHMVDSNVFLRSVLLTLEAGRTREAKANANAWPTQQRGGVGGADREARGSSNARGYLFSVPLKSKSQGGGVLAAFVACNSVRLLQDLMCLVRAGEVDQDNICVINTALVFFIFAERRHELAACMEAVADLDRELLSQALADPLLPDLPTPSDTEARGHQSGAFRNFKSLLEFWREYYLQGHDRDIASLQYSTSIPYAEWRQIVDLLCKETCLSRCT